MAAPMIVLYFVSIVVAWLFGKKRRPTPTPTAEVDRDSVAQSLRLSLTCGGSGPTIMSCDRSAVYPVEVGPI